MHRRLRLLSSVGRNGIPSRIPEEEDGLPVRPTGGAEAGNEGKSAVAELAGIRVFWRFRPKSGDFGYEEEAEEARYSPCVSMYFSTARGVR